MTFFELLILLDLLHTMPYVGFYMPSIVYVILIGLTYLVGWLQLRGRYVQMLVRDVLPVSGIFVLMFILIWATNLYPVSIAAYQLFQYVLTPLIGFYILRFGNPRFVKFVFFELAFIYVVTSITTINGCIDYPLAARELTGNQADAEVYDLYKSMNIGDFHFVYFITLSIPLLIGLIKQKVVSRFWSSLVLALFVITIYFTSYTTALLIALLALSLLFVSSQMNYKTTRLLAGVLVLSVVIGSSFVNDLLNFIADLALTKDVSSRLMDVSAYISGEEMDSEGDMIIRVSKFQKSLISFYSNPILGTWDKQSVGGHSYLLDNLALFGLLGFLSIYIMYKKIYIAILKNNKNKSWFGFIYVSFLLSLVQALLNPTPSLNILVLAAPIYVVINKIADNKI